MNPSTKPPFVTHTADEAPTQGTRAAEAIRQSRRAVVERNLGFVMDWELDDALADGSPAAAGELSLEAA